MGAGHKSLSEQIAQQARNKKVSDAICTMFACNYPDEQDGIDAFETILFQSTMTNLSNLAKIHDIPLSQFLFKLLNAAMIEETPQNGCGQSVIAKSFKKWMDETK